MAVDIAVLGAGITGSCLALELAGRGYRVDLIDKASDVMLGASGHNEGKLHLGFVYAKDPGKRTHQQLIAGSLAFPYIINKLTGSDPSGSCPTNPFHYYVPRDSQLGIDDVARHFEAVEQMVLRRFSENNAQYCGQTPQSLFRRNSAEHHRELFSERTTLGSFATQERAVPVKLVAELLRRAIASSSNINLMTDTLVESVETVDANRLTLNLSRTDDRITRQYPAVVNCLWEDRTRLDRMLGVEDPGPWIYRFKANVWLTRKALASSAIPSATGVLGPYGDVVNHGDGDFYISWYPLCRVAQQIDGDGRDIIATVHPNKAQKILRSLVKPFPGLASGMASMVHRKFIKQSIGEMSRYIPAVAELLKTPGTVRVGGGVIVARGSSDIDDHQSGLHARSEIGPKGYGNYITVDTGKYCMGPYFAAQTADMVDEALR